MVLRYLSSGRNLHLTTEEPDVGTTVTEYPSPSTRVPYHAAPTTSSFIHRVAVSSPPICASHIIPWRTGKLFTGSFGHEEFWLHCHPWAPIAPTLGTLCQLHCCFYCCLQCLGTRLFALCPQSHRASASLRAGLVSCTCALPYHHPVRCPNLPKLHFWLTGSSLRWWLRALTPRFLSLFYLRCLLLKACSPGWCGHQGHCRWHAHVAGFSKFPREFLLHLFTYPPLRWSFFQMASKSRRRHTSVSSSDPPRCLSLRECSRCLLRNMPSVTCDRLATSCSLALNTFFRRWNTCSRCHVCDWGSGYWPAPRKPLF